MPYDTQFITTLGSIQSQLQPAVAEANRGSSPAAPSAEDLAGYDRRLETLRRRRDDLVSAAAAADAAASAAAAAKNAEENEPPPQQQQQQEQEQHKTRICAAQQDGAGGARGAATMHTNPQTSSPRKSRNRANKAGGSGGGVFGGRRAAGGGEGGDVRQGVDEAEADQVAQEISSMAGRLKESSMAINQTLRTQTQVSRNNRRRGQAGFGTRARCGCLIFQFCFFLFDIDFPQCLMRWGGPPPKLRVSAVRYDPCEGRMYTVHCSHFRGSCLCGRSDAPVLS